MAMPARSSPNEGRADLRKVQTSGSAENAPNDLPEEVESSTPDALDQPQCCAGSLFSNLRNQESESVQRSSVPRDVCAALTYGLELVRYGALLVAEEGHLRLANHAALAILDKKDGLSLSRTGLVADRASDTRLLMMLLREAIKAPEQGEPQASPLTLPRETARTSLIVRILPGPGLECWPGMDSGAALMMLYDQDVSFEVNLSTLSKLYGLTRGEAVLTASLMRGKSIDEAADELFISPHTARTHLKRIFMKTDTHRQAELVLRAFPALL